MFPLQSKPVNNRPNMNLRGARIFPLHKGLNELNLCAMTSLLPKNCLSAERMLRGMKTTSLKRGSVNHPTDGLPLNSE